MTCPLCHHATTDLQPTPFNTCQACPTCRARLLQVQVAELGLRMVRMGFAEAENGRDS